MRQVSAKASTHGEADASLLVQQLDGRLSLKNSLHMAARIHLAIILSADEALHNLGTFAFFALHIFPAFRHHLSAIAKLLCVIERLKELHTEVHGMISSPHLVTTLLYNVSRQWI